MANWFPVSQWRTPNLYAIPGRFTTNTTSDPDNVIGRGFSVAYAATGLFNVTFDTNHNTLVAIPYGTFLAADGEIRISLTGWSAGSDGVNATAQWTASLLNTGAYAATATSDDDEVHFCALFQNTGFDYDV